MRLSVVIPCRDRWTSLRTCLESVHHAQENYEGDVSILVIDDRSNPPLSQKISPDFPKVNVVASSGRGPGAARNEALERCRGGGVIFTDSDCVVSREWLSVAADWLSKEGPPVAQGVPWLFQKKQNPSLGQQEEALYETMFSTYLINGTCRQIDTRNLILRPEVLNRHTELRFPTQMETAAAEARVFAREFLRRGLPITWLPELTVFHEDPSDMRAVCRQKYRHGSGRIHVWDASPSSDHLLERYFTGPIAAGVPEDYVIPAHLAFLQGYWNALASEGEEAEGQGFLTGRLQDRYGDSVSAALSYLPAWLVNE